LRKTLIAALAALAALAMATVALAQNPAPVVTVTAKASPSKAGTKAKPKSESVNLLILNSEESKTSAKRIEILFPKTLKLSTTGLKSCSVATLDNQGPAACGKAKAGSGSAVANLNPDAPSKLYFRSTPYVAGKNKLAFYLQQTASDGGPVLDSGVQQALPATIKKSGSGQKITIDIPPNLQQPAPGTFSALLKIQSTLGLKSGKHALVQSIGCNKKQHKLGVTITYVPNPNPPAKPSATGNAGAACSGKAI
jgi:hypothetical protein